MRAPFIGSRPLQRPSSVSYLLLLCLGLVIALGGISPALAGVVNVTWDPPLTNTDGTPVQDLAGYRLYYGPLSHASASPPCNTTVIDVGNAMSHQLRGLSQGAMYYAQVTAYDTAGNESACSTESKGVANPETYVLTVTKAGTGSGSVTSAPAGITCGATCSASYALNTAVTLTAARASGSTFSGWSGACTGTGSCSVTMSQARSVTATFQPATTSAKGPVAAYSFNRTGGTTLPDVSGNNHTATVTGATWTAGKYSNALSFTGLNSYADTGYAANLAKWTIMLWVKSPAAPSSAAPSGPLNREKNFQINWNHPNAAFRGAAALSVHGTWYAGTFGSLAADRWYHLTATYDGETLRTYKNGNLVSTNATPSGAPDAESASLKIGRNAIAPQYFKGLVDEVRIYDRPLSQSEIQAVMSVALP